MSQSILARIDRLERLKAPSGRRMLIISTRSMPEPPTRAAVDRWLSEGLAHFAFGSDFIVLYDGGRPPMTSEEWMHNACPAQA
jgi:hypothetical protein